jgi:hypothetical protein
MCFADNHKMPAHLPSGAVPKLPVFGTVSLAHPLYRKNFTCETVRRDRRGSKSKLPERGFYGGNFA